jgi:hypothetical protein
MRDGMEMLLSSAKDLKHQGGSTMNKRIRIISFTLALVWSSAIVSAQDQAPAPSFKEGDTWQFNIERKGQIASSSEQLIGMYELAFLQGKIKVYEINGGQKAELAINPDGPGEGLLALVGQTELRPHLRFPLSVGQKWTYEYKIRPTGAKQDQNRSVEVTVTGIEQVTTPGGSFKAYKLVRTESWLRPGRQTGWNTITTTYFYSPETRSTIKRSSSNDANAATVELQLIKFTPGN